jgi:hypothetical protein
MNDFIGGALMILCVFAFVAAICLAGIANALDRAVEVLEQKRRKP